MCVMPYENHKLARMYKLPQVHGPGKCHRGRELAVRASGMFDVAGYDAEFSIVMWVRISGVAGPTAIGQRTSGKTATENVSRR